LCIGTYEPEGWRTTIKSAKKGSIDPAGLLLSFCILDEASMDKKTALQIIFTCATNYRANLSYNNLLFICGKVNDCTVFQTAFPEQNYMHLTGVETTLTASEFFRDCIDRRLTVDQFSFAANGTTSLKLEILPRMMEIYKEAKMVGDYNESGKFLVTEKIIGGVTINMGFVRDKNAGNAVFYVPNTVLKGDIRNMTAHPQKRVLAIYKKGLQDTKYSDICYLAKGINADELP
jgi:hypothetical protein